MSDQTPQQALEGRHAVREALRSGHPLYKLYLLKGGEGLGLFRDLARKNGVVVQECDRRRLDSLSQQYNDGTVGAHQGVLAIAAAHEYADPADIWRRAEQSGQPPFVVVCDGVEDPRNLGAIIRTAESAGAHGLVVPKRRSAGLTMACAKAAAGALELLPVARVPNISAFLETCKQQNMWVYGAESGDGAVSIYQTKFDGGVALVLGAEGDGLSRLVKENCDHLLHIPMKGKTPSLNVSAAAAILLFEISRQLS